MGGRQIAPLIGANRKGRSCPSTLYWISHGGAHTALLRGVCASRLPVKPAISHLMWPRPCQPDDLLLGIGLRPRSTQKGHPRAACAFAVDEDDASGLQGGPHLFD